MPNDSPIAFFDVSWIAVRAASVESILEALGLSSPVPATWRQGMNAVVGDYWDFSAPLDAPLSRVFITPEIEGWRLAVGGWLGDRGSEAPDREIAEYCRRLNRPFGEAQAFTTQGRMDWYAWCLARDGAAYRRFLWGDVVLIDDGVPTPAEMKSREAAATKGVAWRPSEGAVMTIAGGCSIDPDKIATESSGRPGNLAITAWGRQHGVPSRPLDDDGVA
jgi:hypothetical protein